MKKIIISLVILGFMSFGNTAGAYKLDHSPTETSPNTTGSLASWSNSSMLDVTVTAQDSGPKLGNSVLKLDYANGFHAARQSATGNENTPTPEPATMLLLGSGLAGLGLWGKRRKIPQA